MINLTVKDIAQYTNATVKGDENLVINKVVTDSRKDVKDSLFIALKGEKFDGHSYAQDVASKGAKAIVVDHDLNLEITQIIVEDTRIALGLIGKLNRQRSKAKVCSITGTCGKTTVKEMTFEILKTMGKTIATKGNLNNDIGVPLTLLEINSDTEYAVVEMGANHPGEITYSVNLACPIAATINNVGSAHLEGFGSLHGVYETKSEILDYVLNHDGVGFVNSENEFINDWQKDYKEFYGNHLFSFGLSDTDKVRAYNIEINENGCASFSFEVKKENELLTGKVELALPGKHNVLNALSAISLASSLGATAQNIIDGLENVKPVAGRLSFKKLDNVILIDDAYNASYTSVIASIDTLSMLDGKKVFIFADMGELGEFAQKLHENVGEHAFGKIDYLLTFGKLAKFATDKFISLGCKAQGFTDKEELKKAILPLLNEEKVYVAVKGSHAMNMHEIVDFICNSKVKEC